MVNNDCTCVMISNFCCTSIYICTIRDISISISICKSCKNILNGSISIGNSMSISNSKSIGINISNDNIITLSTCITITIFCISSIYICTIKDNSRNICICTSCVHIFNGSISIWNSISTSNSISVGISISNNNIISYIT